MLDHVYVLWQMTSSESSTSDSESESSGEIQQHVPPIRPPPRPLGRIPCWCVRCKGMMVRQAWKTIEHIENYGRHDGDEPGYSRRQVQFYLKAILPWIRSYTPLWGCTYFLLQNTYNTLIGVCLGEWLPRCHVGIRLLLLLLSPDKALWMHS